MQDKNSVSTMGFSVEGNVLYWTPSNSQLDKAKIQQDVVQAVTKVKGGQMYPDLQPVTNVKYKPAQQPTWQVGK